MEEINDSAPDGGTSSSAINDKGTARSMKALATAAAAFLHAPLSLAGSKSPTLGSAPTPEVELPTFSPTTKRRGSENPSFASTAPHADSFSTDDGNTLYGKSALGNSISVDEAQRQVLREMFDGADVKKRGWISVPVAKRLLTSFGVTMDNTDMDELIREVTADDCSVGLSTTARAALIRSSSKRALISKFGHSTQPTSPTTSPSTRRESSATLAEVPSATFSERRGSTNPLQAASPPWSEDDENDDDDEDDDLLGLSIGADTPEDNCVPAAGDGDPFACSANVEGSPRRSAALPGTSLYNLAYRRRRREWRQDVSIFNVLVSAWDLWWQPVVEHTLGHAASESASLRKLLRQRSSIDDAGVRVINVLPSAQHQKQTDLSAHSNHLHSLSLDGNVLRVSSVMASSVSVNQKSVDVSQSMSRSANPPRAPTIEDTTDKKQRPGVLSRFFSSMLQSFSPKALAARRLAEERRLRYKGIRISFERFHRMVNVWQSAAQFRQFEERAQSSQKHLAAAVETQLLLPDSSFMFFWQVMMLVVSTITLFGALSVFTYQEKHLPRYLSMAAPMELFVSALFAADIIVNFRAVRMERREDGEYVVVDSRERVAIAYLGSMWFWIDLFACIPFRFLFMTIGSFDYIVSYNATTGELSGPLSDVGCIRNSCDTIEDLRTQLMWTKLFVMLRVLKYFSHVTYFKESRLVMITEGYVSRFFNAAQLLTDLSNFVVLLQLFATVFLAINPRTDAEATHGGGLVLARAYYLIISVFSSVGYGDITPRSIEEQYYFMVLIITGALVNGIVIGQAVQFFQQNDIQSRKNSALLELSAMCEYFSIPSGLKNEVLAFYNHVASSDIMVMYKSLFDCLPVELQGGLQLASRLQLIKQLPYFDDLHRSARFLLCDCLVKHTFCPEQYIIYTGEIGNEMFFLSHGFVDIIGPGGVYLVTLRQGAYFGEMAIIESSPQPRTADVKAITFCEVYVLGKEGFQEILSKYPRLRAAVREIADKRRNALKQSVAQPPAGVPPSLVVSTVQKRSTADTELTQERESGVPPAGGTFARKRRSSLMGANIEVTFAITPKNGAAGPRPFLLPSAQQSSGEGPNTQQGLEDKAPPPKREESPEHFQLQVASTDSLDELGAKPQGHQKLAFNLQMRHQSPTPAPEKSPLSPGVLQVYGDDVTAVMAELIDKLEEELRSILDS